MKKLLRDPADLVRDALTGLEASSGGLVRVLRDPDVVLRSDAPAAGRVAVVSGGGSGHEPLHTGFVGPGMLTAAVPGPVFTSPVPDAVLAALRAADGGAGSLLVVKNYTGDVLNFETAAELASAEGLAVETVLVADDVAVEDSTFTAGRRGTAGTVVVEKVAGAAAERGDGLDAVAALAGRAAAAVRSMGVALAAPVVPHSGRPSFDLGGDEIELGIGIHGEPGRERRRMPPLDELVALLVDPVLDDAPPARDEAVLLIVNGMGGTPLAELHVVVAAALDHLARRGVRPARVLAGDLVTSLDMQGCSITLGRMDDELLELWDAPVRTPAWRAGR